MRWSKKLVSYWNSQSLAAQFLLIGGLVSLIAMALVGIVVTRVIEENVTRNSAASTALYVDSVIAPLLPDMRKNEALSGPVAHALDETLGQGALGKRLMSFRLWGKDGTILYSNDKRLMGKRFEPNPNLKTAFAGKMVAQFNQVDDIDSNNERESGQTLLEIYNPVLQPWSGEVVAVSEFYEIATDFARSLFWARVWSWLAVAAATLGFFLVLSAIVFRGSRTITQQSRALTARVLELSGLLAQNRLLHARVQRASQRAVALNESYLRRIGADLHDGPAQLVALASMKLDGSAVLAPSASPESREREIDAIKSSLDEALYEIRSICRGLILPHIETQRTREVIAHAARSHDQRTGATVQLSLSDAPCELSLSGKICAYRFVQEALSNAYHHAGGAGQAVRQACEAGRVIIEVSDSGPGFDPERVGPEALGLAGLRERVESLGGIFTVQTSEKGTTVRMILELEEVHAP